MVSTSSSPAWATWHLSEILSQKIRYRDAVLCKGPRFKPQYTEIAESLYFRSCLFCPF